MSLKNSFPLFQQLSNYSQKKLRKDLIAGLTVGVMLIPQGMAYAMLAGLPPIYGLYASTIPLLIYAFLGTSRQLAVGPVAMISLMTASGIGAIAQGGIETYILLATTLTFIVGLIQFLLGIFRMGFLVNFLSHPVISGFTSAAALIIGLSQLKHLLGIEIPRSHHIHEILFNAFHEYNNINWITFGIGIGGIVIILLFKKWAKAIPSQLVAVVLGILLVWVFNLSMMEVKIVGTVPEGLPSFSMPTFDKVHWSALMPIALTIALVSFMESIAVAKAIQSKHKNYKVIPNQELIALGAANIGGAFFQSYPVTGGFSRTAVNDQSGAQTNLAAIFSMILILLTLLFLTPLFYFLPKAILASIIMVAVFGLIDFQEAKHLWHSNKTDFWMLLTTFIATLTLGIELGIGIGVLLSIGMVIFQSTRPHVAILGQVPSTHFYRNIQRFPDIQERSDLLIIRFDAQLYFANIQFFKDTIEQEITRKGNDLRAVIINADSTHYMDSSAIHTLKEVLDFCKNKNIQLFFSGVKGPVRDQMEKGDFTSKLGPNRLFMNIQQAVDFFDQKFTEKQIHQLQTYTLQVNP